MNIWKRINNKGTIVALAGLVVGILVNFGIDIPKDEILYAVDGICTICVIVGVLNNPTTPGIG